MPGSKNEGLVAPGTDGGKQAGPSLPKLNVCGDIGLKITRDGTWFYAGTPIGRKPLVKLFASVLRRESGGYYLVTPVEKVPIEVEGEPFIAVEMSRRGEGSDQTLIFRTNVDGEVQAGPGHRIAFRKQQDGSHTPYVELDDGLTAQLARPVYYQLTELAVEGEDGLGVWSGGAFFSFPLDDD